MRVVKLLEDAIVQHSDLVEVEDGLEFVRDGNNGVFGEPTADDALDELIGCFVHTIVCLGQRLRLPDLKGE